MKLKRQILHDLIWTYPAMRVAGSLGISSSSLAKTCGRRGIPTPPRGYWQSLASGKEMPIPSLAPVEFELPLPWTATPELEVLFQSRMAGAKAGEQLTQDPPEPRPLAMAVDIAHGSETAAPPPTPTPRPPSTPRKVRDADVITRASLNDAAAMAALASEIHSCERFCHEVLRVAKNQPLAVGEVMEAWVVSVRRYCRERDPLAALVDQCTKIAQQATQILPQGSDAESNEGK